jgi:hypothetical protein
MLSVSFFTFYEGNILEKAGAPCILSSPGKFGAAWNEVTRLGRSTKADVSAACVFLPMRTPDFGQHVDNPKTAGKCYCPSLYGEQKTWGCKVKTCIVLLHASPCNHVSMYVLAVMYVLTVMEQLCRASTPLR